MSGPNRVQSSDDLGGVAEWWYGIPPVTRLLGGTWFASAVLQTFQVLPLSLLYLDFYSIVRRLQVWRLVTSAGFLAGFSPRFAINMLWLFIYSPVMERTMTEFSPGEYAFFVSFSVLVLDLIGLLNPWYPMFFIAEKLVFAILYLWSREFPNQDISMYGLINIKGFYLPWAMMAMGVIFGGGATSIVGDLIGIGVGHLYYFLKTIYPAQTGQQILKCPMWLTRFMVKYYKQPQQQQQSGRRTAGFQAFQGRGRRLHD